MPLEKCYGVSKAGKTDCQTSSSACAGTAKKDGQKDAWIFIPKGSCERLSAPRLNRGQVIPFARTRRTRIGDGIEPRAAVAGKASGADSRPRSRRRDRCVPNNTARVVATPRRSDGSRGPQQKLLRRRRATALLSRNGYAATTPEPARRRAFARSRRCPFNRAHLEKLKALIRRYEPGLVSDHLSWSSVDGRLQ